MAADPTLSHGVWGKRVSASVLRPGDIVASTTRQLPSQVIRVWTHSQFSHVMLYAGHGRVVEAVEQGVVHRPLVNALHGALRAVVFRCKNLSAASAHTAVAYALSKARAHLKYDYQGAAGGGARANPVACVAVLTLTAGPIAGIAACGAAVVGGVQDPNKYYCSELVLEAFQKAGAPLGSHAPEVSTPQDIVDAANAGQLDCIGHLR